MRERPPPMIEGKQRIECEFVIPNNSFCLLFGLPHTWEAKDDRVKVCALCDAEWWTVEDLTKKARDAA